MSIPRRVRERDRMSIIAEILLVAQDPALKTQIMYRANLSFAQLMVYLKFMTELGFLETIRDENGEPKAYQATKKGLHYLKAYKEVRALLQKQPVNEALVYPKRRLKLQ